MTDFAQRQRGFEGAFSHAAEIEFKLKARRNKKVAYWAAELQGLSGTVLENYILEVIASDLDVPGDEDIIQKIATDFQKSGIDKGSQEIAMQLDKAYQEILSNWQNENL